MAWNSPPTAREQDNMTPDPYAKCEIWFAWYPVKVDNGTTEGKWVWMREVYREMVLHHCGFWWEYYEK
jgi:hypothetical protein